MAEALTPVERKVYQYLLDFLAENTYQPSIREIGRKFRIKSTKTVSDLLQSLCAKGYIERDPSRSRGVRIVGYGGPTRVQPVPVHDGTNGPTGNLGLDRRFVGGADAFVVRMRGDSLRGRGVLDGDYVVVAPSVAPSAGDLVAVRLGEEMAIREHDGVGAATAALAASSTDASAMNGAFQVLGVVSGILRAYLERDAFEGAIPT